MTDGWLGDQIVANRKIRPFTEVKRRKYRFRLLNGGPSRFYRFQLRRKKTGELVPMTIITGDGNILPEPVRAWSVYMSVAQRVDVILDFSDYDDGEQLILENLLEQTNGKGPSGRILDDPDGVLAFNVTGTEPYPDNSRVPSKLRDLPEVDLSLVRKERTWTFDYDGGLWTINSKIMDPNRIDALVEQNSAEIWTFRNSGNDWSHPVHCHFTEFMILEVNGKPYDTSFIQSVKDNRSNLEIYKGYDSGDIVETFMGGPRRDVATILPNDEIKVYIRFNDFLGKHVMHCHNVVHEDHAMMIRWDIVRPEDLTKINPATNKPYQEPVNAFQFYNQPENMPHLEARPGQATYQSSDGNKSYVKEDDAINGKKY
jgi:FtsP/CotA-like multicopper oxidase with cupredoxin domain